MVRRQTRVKKRNRRQQNKTRNNRRQNKSLRRKRQSRVRGGGETPEQRAAREAQQRELDQMQRDLDHMQNQIHQIKQQSNNIRDTEIARRDYSYGDITRMRENLNANNKTGWNSLPHSRR